MRLTGRGEREAAVAADGRGDPVERGGACRGIPRQLGVVVGVDVDEARRHDEPTGVDDVRRPADVVGRDEAAVTYGDVSNARREPPFRRRRSRL